MFACTNRIRGFLERHGKVCLTEAGNASELKIQEGTECVIVLGGDGTLLRASRTAADAKVPLIGVNLGTLGYLAEVDSDDLEEALERLIRDDFTREKRMMLFGRVLPAVKSRRLGSDMADGQCEKMQSDDPENRRCEEQRRPEDSENMRYKAQTPAAEDRQSDCALNDIAITRKGSLQIIVFHIYVNGLLLQTCHADGILVATPTGSTGYNLSAGGPIVEPNAQLILLTPICPHSMSSRTIVLSAEDEIVIEIGENKKKAKQEVEACFDGSVKMAMFAGDRMEIRRAGKVTEMLKLSQDSFVEVLHKKMDA